MLILLGGVNVVSAGSHKGSGKLGKQARKAKCPAKFAKAYPDATWSIVSRENYVGFVNGEI